MSLELYAKIKTLEARVKDSERRIELLEQSVFLLITPPVSELETTVVARIPDPEPSDKRTREWKEWQTRNAMHRGYA